MDAAGSRGSRGRESTPTQRGRKAGFRSANTQNLDGLKGAGSMATPGQLHSTVMQPHPAAAGETRQDMAGGAAAASAQV